MIAFELNPWWKNKNWQKKDKDIQEFEAMKVRWIPKWINRISLTPFSMCFIIGPRQVGKTTGIKLLISELLKKSKPQSVFYLNLELISNIKEFREILLWYFKFASEENIKKCHFFFDEVTSLNEWWKIVKGFIDLGKFRNSVVVCSASSTAKLLKHAEAFPGRRGGGKDIVVLPLSFREFLQIHGIETKCTLYETEIKDLFGRYLETGGFPRTINQKPFFEDFIRSIEREVEKAKKSVEIFKQITTALLEMVPSALSYNAIATRLGISHKTVEEYIELMENLFLAKRAYYKGNKGVVFRKEKKIFFRDPFTARAFSIWCGRELRKDALYEWIVQEHLFRKFKEIYYFRNSYEIDCIANNLKIEVKVGKPHRKYPRGVEILSEEKLPLFLTK